MNKKMLATLVAVSVMLTGCSGGASSSAPAQSNAPANSANTASGETFTLKIGNTVSDIDPFNVALREFETAVEEATNGQVQVELFTNGSIGETDADVLDKVRSNTLQMGHTTPNCLADLSGISEYYVYGVPYLMATNDELNTVAESEWIAGLNDQFREKSGVRIFDGGGVNMGFFAFSHTKKEVTSINDLQGDSIRINQTSQMIALAEGAKINPQFIAFSEVYTALAQGTVDGMVTNAPLYYSNGFYDQLTSILTTHCGESYHFYIINDQFYNSLPTEFQTILDENVTTLIARTRQLEDEYLEEAITKIREAGVMVTEAPAEDEAALEQISRDNVWWNEGVALTSNDNVNQVLDIIGKSA